MAGTAAVAVTEVAWEVVLAAVRALVPKVVAKAELAWEATNGVVMVAAPKVG